MKRGTSHVRIWARPLRERKVQCGSLCEQRASPSNTLDSFIRLCGGCNSLATSKTIKTAYQSEIVDTKNCPRHCDVWSVHSKSSGTNNSNNNSNKRSGRSSKHLTLPATHCMLLLLLLNLAAMLTSAVAVPTLPTTAAAEAKSLLATAIKNGSSPAAVHTDRQQSERNALPQAGTARLRKRHSKRHSDWYNYNENSTEWNNPCGGNYNATKDVPVKRKSLRQVINPLKKSVHLEYKKMLTASQDINITNIQMWYLHRYQYKFLPKLKLNSSVALIRWHRNLRTYVASFSYLLRVQLKWDHSKPQRESRISHELKNLLWSSMRMTCELESAVNSTRPRAIEPQITRTVMNNRLKLRTKRRLERNPDALLEADPIDLKFVKHYYYEFLKTMGKVLLRSAKRKGQIALKDNRREFNEVEKNFGSKAARRSSGATSGAASAQLRAASSSSSESASSRGKSKRRHGGAHKRSRTAQRASDTPA